MTTPAWHLSQLVVGVDGRLAAAHLPAGGADHTHVHDHYSEALNTVSASGSTETIDAASASVHDVTLTANCTITLTGSTASRAFSITLLLRQDGTGSRTVTWPGSVTWAAGSAPTLATAAGSIDTIVLVTVNGGTTWLGYV